jgi:glycosyltransferase involved in cell wall biosynthesis
MAPSSTQRLHAWVELVHFLDAASWPARNAAGEVPGHTPFGIDELAEFGIDVTFRGVLTNRVARRLGRFSYEHATGVEWVEELRWLADRRRRTADVIMCWDEFVGIPSIITSRLLPGSPPVVSGVEQLSDIAARPEAFQKTGRVLKWADALFVPARAMLNVLQEAWDLDPRRLYYVPVGIDIDWFTPGDTPPQPDRVVSIGDDPLRDYDTVVRAVAAVQAKRPGTRLEVATQLPVDVPADVGSLYRFHLGPKRREFYQSAAVVAMAAKPNFHGSGITVISEAMACGRPYVVTASAGLEDYVADGVDGFVVPAGDADAMAQAIDTLLADPQMAEEMGRAGRKRAEQSRTTRVQAEILAGMLRDVVG